MKSAYFCALRILPDAITRGHSLETPNMSRSQHIIVAEVKQEHHPLNVIWNPHLLPGIGLFSLFFFFLRIPALFSRIPHFAAARANRKFATFLSSGSTSALSAYEVIHFAISLRCCVSFGDVCEVFRLREEEDPVFAASGGRGAGQSAVSADATGQWTRPARESEESMIFPPLSFSPAAVSRFSLVSVLAEHKQRRPGLVVTL